MSRTAAALAILLAIGGAPPVSAETPRASVALLMDLSYSLQLREGGAGRLDLLREAVSALVAARGIEWALLSFRDLGDFRVHVPFTEEPAQVRSALTSLPLGRLSPIREAVGWAGEYLASHAQSQRRAVVLVSDGIGNGGSSFAAAVGKGFADEGLALFVLGVDHTDNPPIRQGLEELARETGGGYFTYRRVDDLARALARLPARRVAGAPPARATRLAQLHPLPLPQARPGGMLQSVHRWLLGSGACGLVAFAALRARWRSDDRRRRAGRRVRQIVELWVVRPQGRTERLQFDRPPVTVGAGADARIRVPAARRRGFSIAWDQERAWLESASPVIVNGVAQKRRLLRTNDRVVLGATRIIFRGMSEREETEEAAAPRRPDLTPLAAVSAILLVLGAIFAAARMMGAPAAAAVKAEGRAAVSTAAPAGAAPTAAPADTVRPAAARRREALDVAAAAGEALRHEAPRMPQPASPPAPAAAPRPQPAAAPAAAARAAFAAAPDGRSAPRAAVRRVAPGEPVPFFDADILFFHAHPDDESLDFAGLMSLAARRGLKMAVVIFTDGESGIDQYPDRPSGGLYEARVMTGADLARARVEEAGRALELLGAAMYVRLGLPNHPYTTSADELQRDRILESWGGEERLVSRVAELVRGFRPEVVVSSDFNEKAYEHFEHKAVGYVVAEALERVFDAASSGGSAASRPEGAYLVSVDPFQGPLYGEIVRLDLMLTDPLSGLSYREVQMAALKEHASQADASLLGVEFLPNFRYEQYHPVYWNLPARLADMLSAR